VLEGFWPQYLAAYGGWEAAAPTQTRIEASPRPPAAADEAASETTFRQRIWNWAPRWR
jgi:hypothetical protein